METTKRYALAFGFLAVYLWPEYLVRIHVAQPARSKQFLDGSLSIVDYTDARLKIDNKNLPVGQEFATGAHSKRIGNETQKNNKISSQSDRKNFEELGKNVKGYGLAINHREILKNSSHLQVALRTPPRVQSQTNRPESGTKNEQTTESPLCIASWNTPLEEPSLNSTILVNRYGLAIGNGYTHCMQNHLPRKHREGFKDRRQGRIEESNDCIELTKYFEKKYNIPTGLLLAIANVESTRRPWAVNNYKESRYFNSQDEAVEYIRHLEKSRQSSISVGIMQVNWAVHKNNFKSIREAFTPFKNVEFAAKLLFSLYLRFGSWERAVMWYNPCGSKPNYEYLKKIRKNCNV